METIGYVNIVRIIECMYTIHVITNIVYVHMINYDFQILEIFDLIQDYHKNSNY